MGRHIASIISGGLVLATIGCSDSNRALPTSPELAITVGTCDLSTARGLVNSIFSADARTPAKTLIQTIGNSGARDRGLHQCGLRSFCLVGGERSRNGRGPLDFRERNPALPKLRHAISLPADRFHRSLRTPMVPLRCGAALPQMRRRWSRMMGFGAWSRFSTSL